MPFRFTATELPGLLLIEPVVFADERGFFMETYKHSEFAAQGIDEHFVQANQSHSSRGALRGLHFQNPPVAQAKLVRALAGEIYDVVVDIRRGSPTFGKWQGVHLSDENKHLLYVPAGFAHGFCVTSEMADISYMTSAEYAPASERGIIWDDPDLKIAWPIDRPQLSQRDRGWPRLCDMSGEFRY
ncbi:MAG TPA: dTDP-4-dehydrorhamnose 3,5-epimerase [Terriglobales bacterium]|jgi:dTDP-4-dehydrorhamnose 3,5-epimerase|nr:dTDP-4-dehydrorhamnose 3,5-epimerase [Terriglobales bacterium]